MTREKEIGLQLLDQIILLVYLVWEGAAGLSPPEPSALRDRTNRKSASPQASKHGRQQGQP